MPTRYTHCVPLNYAGFLYDVFDRHPKEVKPVCTHEPKRVYGRFERSPIRIDVCVSQRTFVWGRSQAEAKDLSTRICKKSVRIANNLPIEE